MVRIVYVSDVMSVSLRSLLFPLFTFVSPVSSFMLCPVPLVFLYHTPAPLNHFHMDQRRGSLLCPPAISFTPFWRELEIGTKVNNSGSRQKERAFISTCHKDQKKGILALASCLLLHLILAKVGDWNKSAHLRLLPKRESI